MDNTSMVHVKGLALSNGWINYPTDLFLNGSNLSATFSWNASWHTLLPELTSKMALQVLQQLAEETQYGPMNTDAMLSIDWEPKFRPSWNITVGEGEAHETQPAWSALLEHVHGNRLDQGWISLVGWNGPSGGREKKWGDLSKQQQRTLEEASWNYFVREYISTAITKMKLNTGLKKLRVGFWDWPFKFWYLPAVKSAPLQWQQWMDELGWLWAMLDVFLPDLYPDFYAGPVSERPPDLSKCIAQNSSSTSWYYGAVVEQSLRLKKDYQPSASIVLVGWYHYMCANHYMLYPTQAQADRESVFVKDGNVEALFKAAAIAGGDVQVALWGSIGAAPDDQMDALRAYLDLVYTPIVLKYCTESRNTSAASTASTGRAH